MFTVLSKVIVKRQNHSREKLLLRLILILRSYLMKTEWLYERNKKTTCCNRWDSKECFKKILHQR